jgi:hypothetical protein
MTIHHQRAADLSLLGKFSLLLKTTLNKIRDKYVALASRYTALYLFVVERKPDRFSMEDLPFEILYRVLHFVRFLNLLLVTPFLTSTPR